MLSIFEAQQYIVFWAFVFITMLANITLPIMGIVMFILLEGYQNKYAPSREDLKYHCEKTSYAFGQNYA